MLGQALDRALGDRARDPPLRPRGRADGRGARGLRARRLRAAVLRARRPRSARRRHRRASSTRLAEEFFRAVASAARLTLHVDLEAGTNAHHMIEACFKAFARALREAVAIDPARPACRRPRGRSRDRDRRLRDGQPPQRREGARARRRARRAHRPTTTRSAAADGIVLPGVGAFPEAMRRLRALGLDEVLRERAARASRCSGICLGMQLLFDALGRARGRRGPRPPPGRRRCGSGAGAESRTSAGTSSRSRGRRALTEGLGDGAAFYHVHSFACRPADAADVVGRGEYGERFVSIVERGTSMGVQFHPEKSSRDGLALLRNFAASARVAGA